MRNVLPALLAGLVLGGAVAWSLSSRLPALAEVGHSETGFSVGRGSHGAAEVHLDAEARELAGIEVVALAALELPSEREAYGRVLDPTPLASLVFEVEATRAVEAAARREAERVKSLFRTDENASARELEAAEVALTRAQVTLETARAGLATSCGAPLATLDDGPALVRSLVEGERAIVRVDVPPGVLLPEDPDSTRLLAFDEEAPLTSTFLGAAPQTDPLLQGRGLLFLVERDPPAPGTAVTAWLRAAGPPTRGVDLPRAAVLRHEGGAFVYVERAPGVFERRAVVLVRPSPAGWLAAGPVTAGERVVVAGAAILLSSELQPQLAEG